jgi:hypothetical protein
LNFILPATFFITNPRPQQLLYLTLAIRRCSKLVSLVSPRRMLFSSRTPSLPHAIKLPDSTRAYRLSLSKSNNQHAFEIHDNRWPFIDGADNLSRYSPGGYRPLMISGILHNRYTIVDKFAFGRYSTVWLARDTAPEKFVVRGGSRSRGSSMNSLYLVRMSYMDAIRRSRPRGILVRRRGMGHYFRSML